MKTSGWHGFRRQFAPDLEHVLLPDLQELGGWQTPETLLECYQVADEGTMRDALERRSQGKDGGPEPENSPEPTPSADTTPRLRLVK